MRGWSFLFVFFFLEVQAKELAVEYDRGEKNALRQYQSAEKCKDTPCVITQWGAIKLPSEIAHQYRVELGALHRGFYETITFFQQSTTFEQKLSERIFVKKPNRKIVNVPRLVERGKTDILFMYGILLHYELDEADPLILRLTSLKNPHEVYEFFFRYHHDQAKWDIDVAFVQPINLFYPNKEDTIQAAYSTASISLSIARAMDPERKYNLFSKMTRAVRINLFMGLLLRKDIATFQGDRITKDYFDGFGGLGLTFFNFFALGYGVNMVQSPHAGFPFIGLEFRHLMEFLRTLKTDTHTQWRRFMKEEQRRTEP